MVDEVRVTFDTNTLGKVVEPHRYKNDPEYDAAVSIHEAIKQQRIKGFLSETVGVIESVPKNERLSYLANKAANSISVLWQPSHNGSTVSGKVQIGGQSHIHPGLRPVLAKIFQKAFALGFKVLPSSRIGTLRPEELTDNALNADIPISSDEEIWSFLQTISDITDDIESCGCGAARVFALAKSNKAALGIDDGYWAAAFDRLPFDQLDKAQKAIAEWADGDTVALHLAYKNDVLCTSDKGRGGASVFSERQRKYFGQKYGLVVESISELAKRLR